MIEVNETYKYKELCTIRGESVKTGKSKQLQLKDWQRYFTWENPTKQTFLITEVYDVPFEKIDNRIKLYSSGSDGLPNTEDDIVVNI